MNKAILLVAALLIGWGACDTHSLAHDMRIRRDFAAGLNVAPEDGNENTAFFTTVGPGDRIFVIACDGCGAPADADQTLDYFLAQDRFVDMLIGVGFREISCGGLTRPIHPVLPAAAESLS
jgi:hypothetical protein